MTVNLLLFAAGLILAWLTLRDVFDTVVVPGGSTASLQVTRRVGSSLLALMKLIRGRRRGLSGTFAPLVLVSSFLIWMTLLALAFGLMVYGARGHFTPPIRAFGDAVYEAGSALLTVGLSPHYPVGAGRWIVLTGAFCGLAVMTMAVTYLLEVQSSISRRDTGIIKLNTSAGEPPSALTLLERFAALRSRGELEETLKEGRNWCATVRQSHAAHPSLIYFKSVSTGAGWPAALGALVDLALISEYLLDDDSLYGPAVLLSEEAERLAREIALMIRLEAKPLNTQAKDIERVARRLEAAGYTIRRDVDFAAIASKRCRQESMIEALADHLGKPPAVLVPLSTVS